ncbi:MAG: hypothetical protein EBZ48_06125, partial [Proteobacteria bacterium]|nr:hypothetical protein [Pseudomonadota bacterium]
MPKSRNARARRSKKKAPRRYTLLVIMTLLTALAACVGIFVIVNHRTMRILKARGSTLQSGIYSDARTISAGQKLRPELLRSEFARRGYREVAHAIESPGEFQQRGEIFDLRTRPFIAADGAAVQSVRALYNTKTGEVSVENGRARPAFSLEPQRIADLSSSDIRATRFVALSKIPAPVKEAVIAIEDERFYQHFGVDLIGIGRAAYTNLRALGWVQGGSTLTQQLAKNIFLSPRRTLGRKFLELFTAFSLERELS